MGGKLFKVFSLLLRIGKVPAFKIGYRKVKLQVAAAKDGKSPEKREKTRYNFGQRGGKDFVNGTGRKASP
jgi:hypothetical protein